MAFLLVAIAGFTFGAADQYLGSRTALRARRAAVLGLVVTASALVGYFAMTYSPVEIRIWSFHRFTAGMVAVTTSGYNPMYILAGLVTGPLFGLLGRRWRVRKSWASAAIVAGALCLEPLARWTAGQLPPPAPVWTIEIAAGTVMAVLFALVMLEVRRAEAVSSGPPRAT